MRELKRTARCAREAATSGRDRAATTERAYETTPETIWELWTTAAGIEQWWAPDGFRTEVRELDLRPAVRELWLLDVPGYALCREDCKGLCPTCGTNLNLAQCDCATEEVDPRFAALSNLLADFDTSDRHSNN